MPAGKDLPLQECYWGRLCCLPGKKCCPRMVGNCLPELLPDYLLELRGYYLPGKDLPLQECYWGELHCLPWKKCCPWEGGNLPDYLPEKLLNCFLPKREGECLPAWEATKPSQGAALTALEVALSPGGWEPACLEELNCVDTPVIFPSFFSKLLYLFNCL